MSKTPPPGAIDYEAACALLGLECTADPNQIDDDQLKKAFRKAALKAHPDKGGSDDAFRKVKAASECIVRAKKHGLAHAADANYDSDSEENNFEAFFDEEGDDIMAEIILRMYEMETGRGATGSKRRKIRDLVERLRRSEESKRLEAEKLARVAVCVEIIASSSTPSTRRLLDGLAMPVPHRSTEPARPRRRREMA